MSADNKNNNGSPPASGSAEAARILIADNQELVRDALRAALQHGADEVQILECGSLGEAMDLAAAEKPLSLAVLALRMPGMNGVDGISVFRGRVPDVPLAVLSGCHVIGDIVKAFDYGAIGFISKNNNAISITRAIGLMLAGQRYIPGEVMDAIQRRSSATNLGADVDNAPYPLQRLTEREREVLKLVIEGKSNKAIANCIGVQEVTVKLHIRKLLRKLRVTNRTQAVTFALQAGWGSEI